MAEIKHATESTFLDDVLNANKPTLVYYWAEWCNPCKQMGSIYEEFGKTQETVNLVKVDVDKNQAIAQPYNIMSIPTILLFKDGEVVAQKMGTMTLNELKEFSNS